MGLTSATDCIHDHHHGGESCDDPGFVNVCNLDEILIGIEKSSLVVGCTYDEDGCTVTGKVVACIVVPEDESAPPDVTFMHFGIDGTVTMDWVEGFEPCVDPADPIAVEITGHYVTEEGVCTETKGLKFYTAPCVEGEEGVWSDIVWCNNVEGFEGKCVCPEPELFAEVIDQEEVWVAPEIPEGSTISDVTITPILPEASSIVNGELPLMNGAPFMATINSPDGALPGTIETQSCNFVQVSWTVTGPCGPA